MNSKVPSKQDHLEESIKLSLDAAEAAMDITTEFSEVQEKFKLAAAKTDKIHKLSLYGLIASVSVSLIALLIVAGLFWRTTADLNVVTQSNLKLLKVFTEKITEFQKANQFEKIAAQTDGIKKTMNEVTSTISAITGSMEQALIEVGNLNTELNGLKEALGESQDSLKAANGKMTEMTLAKIAKLERTLETFAASNKNLLSAKVNRVNAQVAKIEKRLRSFNSEFRREMASMKKQQKIKNDDAGNQIKFSR